MIIIADFGSQTTHLISRRITDFGVDVKIVLPKEIVYAVKKYHPSGIILSGGPSSVYEKGAPLIDKKIFSLGIPILGICYGWQLIAHLLGGKVIAGKKEYGPTRLIIKTHGLIFQGIKKDSLRVWMSHGDEVVRLPPGFRYLASSETVKAAACADEKRKIYGLQFHPEVNDTEKGGQILENFLRFVCQETIQKRKIEVEKIIKDIKNQVNKEGKDAQVIGAVSGGVDSTVAGVLTVKAIGKRFIPIFCDNGLMRKGTKKKVEEIFIKKLKVPLRIIDCQKEFLAKLKGVTDPEEKRKIIGRLYINFFQKEARKIKGIKFLLQGTIYSDVIESQGTTYASKIKSHHNVGGLPKKLPLKLLEPLRFFYKDEVKKIGKQLGLSDEIIFTQPYPGPGAAIRIIGEVTKERLEKYHQADKILNQILKKHHWEKKVFQSFPIMTGIKSTAVKGDARVYGEVIAIRIYQSQDIMTAGWAKLPYYILQEISTQIINQIPGVSRVVYDITTKPPATMEWE